MKHLSLKTLSLGVLAVAAFIALVGLISNASLSPARAQQMTTGTENVINVTGIGQAYGAPDVAYIEVGADFADADATVAFSRASDTMNAVRQALLDLGIAQEDLQTSNVSMYAEVVYGPQGGPSEERLYRVTNTLRVIVRDVTQVEAVIGAAIGAGANNLYNLSFGIADPSVLEQDARTEAIADARQRAEQLAELLGVTLGEAVSVSETYSPGYPSPLYNTAGGYGGAAMDVAPVEEGRMQVNVQVQVSFAIVR